jgi:hypothetical protein
MMFGRSTRLRRTFQMNKKRKDSEREHRQRALAKRQRTVDFGLTFVIRQLVIAHAGTGMISIEDAIGMPGQPARRGQLRNRVFASMGRLLGRTAIDNR